MTITLYQYQKRENSTARPSGGSSIEGTLRNNSSVVSPSIEFSAQNLSGYNYAYIPVFSRWYFIRNWSFIDGLWLADMECDTLATYRDQIGASEQYVIRSSAESDGSIVDGYYPAKAEMAVITKESYDQPWENSGTCFVVGIVGDNANSGTGCVSYYMMNEIMFKEFGNTILGSTDYMGSDFGTDVTLDFLKTQINPFQYVVSCMRFPWAASGEVSGNINLGWWSVELGAFKVRENQTERAVFHCDVPKHPQAATRGNYLNSAPFARYNLQIPCFGQIPLPADILCNLDTLYVFCDVDVITGKAMLYVTTSGGYDDIIYKASGQVGATVQIGQISSDFLGAGLGAVGAVGSVLTGNIAGAIGSISSAIDSAAPQLQTNGSNGSFAEFKLRAQLVGEFFTIADGDNANHGRPLCKVRTISSVPGFVMCEKPDIAITGTAEEARTIKTYMEGGFFFE